MYSCFENVPVDSTWDGIPLRKTPADDSLRSDDNSEPDAATSRLYLSQCRKCFVYFITSIMGQGM